MREHGDGLRDAVVQLGTAMELMNEMLMKLNENDQALIQALGLMNEGLMKMNAKLESVLNPEVQA